MTVVAAAQVIQIISTWPDRVVSRFAIYRSQLTVIAGRAVIERIGASKTEFVDG